MPTEQRVISTKAKIAPKATGGVASDGLDEAPKKGGKKKKIILIVLVVLLVVGGAAYWFLLKPAPADGATPAPTPEPVAGKVVVADSVSINLAGGHYLRLGLGLQLTAAVAEAPETAKALDIAIALFSGRTAEEVSDLAQRDALKEELKKELVEAYEGEVMDVYFTDFVSQ